MIAQHVAVALANALKDLIAVGTFNTTTTNDTALDVAGINTNLETFSQSLLDLHAAVNIATTYGLATYTGTDDLIAEITKSKKDEVNSAKTVFDEGQALLALLPASATSAEVKEAIDANPDLLVRAALFTSLPSASRFSFVTNDPYKAIAEAFAQVHKTLDEWSKLSDNDGPLNYATKSGTRAVATKVVLDKIINILVHAADIFARSFSESTRYGADSSYKSVITEKFTRMQTIFREMTKTDLANIIDRDTEDEETRDWSSDWTNTAHSLADIIAECSQTFGRDQGADHGPAMLHVALTQPPSDSDWLHLHQACVHFAYLSSRNMILPVITLAPEAMGPQFRNWRVPIDSRGDGEEEIEINTLHNLTDDVIIRDDVNPDIRDYIQISATAAVWDTTAHGDNGVITAADVFKKITPLDHESNFPREGRYPISYNVKDDTGNAALPLTRMIRVRHTTIDQHIIAAIRAALAGAIAGGDEEVEQAQRLLVAELYNLYTKLGGADDASTPSPTMKLSSFGNTEDNYADFVRHMSVSDWIPSQWDESGLGGISDMSSSTKAFYDALKKLMTENIWELHEDAMADLIRTDDTTGRQMWDLSARLPRLEALVKQSSATPLTSVMLITRFNAVPLKWLNDALAEADRWPDRARSFFAQLKVDSGDGQIDYSEWSLTDEDLAAAYASPHDQGRRVCLGYNRIIYLQQLDESTPNERSIFIADPERAPTNPAGIVLDTPGKINSEIQRVVDWVLFGWSCAHDLKYELENFEILITNAKDEVVNGDDLVDLMNKMTPTSGAGEINMQLLYPVHIQVSGDGDVLERLLLLITDTTVPAELKILKPVLWDKFFESSLYTQLGGSWTRLSYDLLINKSQAQSGNHWPLATGLLDLTDKNLLPKKIIIDDDQSVDQWDAADLLDLVLSLPVESTFPSPERFTISGSMTSLYKLIVNKDANNNFTFESDEPGERGTTQRIAKVKITVSENDALHAYKLLKLSEITNGAIEIAGPAPRLEGTAADVNSILGQRNKFPGHLENIGNVSVQKHTHDGQEIGAQPVHELVNLVRHVVPVGNGTALTIHENIWEGSVAGFEILVGAVNDAVNRPWDPQGPPLSVIFRGQQQVNLTDQNIEAARLKKNSDQSEKTRRPSQRRAWRHVVNFRQQRLN